MAVSNPSSPSARVGHLKQILFEEAKRRSINSPLTCLPRNEYDEVFENCFLSNSEVAMNKPLLKSLGITHVLNAAKGEKFSQVNTSPEYYKDLDIKFMGVSLMDVDNCRIERHFNDGTRFIYEALSSRKGKVLVHCYQGISRSASFVLAYLIKYKQMRLEEAIRMVFERRLIWPNNGFLEKLVVYEQENLNQSK